MLEVFLRQICHWSGQEVADCVGLQDKQMVVSDIEWMNYIIIYFGYSVNLINL